MKNQTTNLVPFEYQEIQLSESVEINGKPYFTRKAIGEWLGYADSQKAIDNILERNQHISEFSVTVKLRATDNKRYDTKVYDPIGFQLIVMESRQPRAVQYKVAVAHLVQAYAAGQLGHASKSPQDRLESEIKNKNADARLKNAITRQAKFLMETAEKFRSCLAPESVQSMISHATEIMIGQKIIALPQIEGPEYTAEQISRELKKEGIEISANMIGRISNKLGLKGEELKNGDPRVTPYGKWILSKSQYSNREVAAFVYNDHGKQTVMSHIRLAHRTEEPQRKLFAA